MSVSENLTDPRSQLILRSRILSSQRSQRSEIDQFILERLAQENLAPSPPAEQRELIRRLWFDVLGLPPAPERIDTFVTDTPPGRLGNARR